MQQVPDSYVRNDSVHLYHGQKVRLDNDNKTIWEITGFRGQHKPNESFAEVFLKNELGGIAIVDMFRVVPL